MKLLVKDAARLLAVPAPRGERIEPDCWTPARAAERELARVLTGFLVARAGDWDPRFFERLLL